jgi:hypothetical protein
MIKDPIVEELDRLRAEQMEKVNFDFDAFFQDLKEQERSLRQPPEPPPAASVSRPTGGRSDLPKPA